MKLRPCIDIHNGKVKQIVGGTLSDESGAAENFVAERSSEFYASLFKSYGMKGGHIILLNKAGTPEYEADMEAARRALEVYPGGFMIGGGVTTDTAETLLELGASHVIVTSYVFSGGQLHRDKLDELVEKIGADRLVLDLSCRYSGDGYYIATDRWQYLTDIKVDEALLISLSDSCSEYLIHAVDVEGKRNGVDVRLLQLLSDWAASEHTGRITYAGGVAGLTDIDRIEQIGGGRIDLTIGSALDIYGGDMALCDVINHINHV